MKKVLIATILSTTFFGVSAYAEGTGFYVGLGLGKVDIDDIAGMSFDVDTPAKLYAGYKFSPRHAVEGHYLNTDIDVSGLLSGKASFKSTGISLVSTFPINPKFSLLGKIGYTKNKAKVKSGPNIGGLDDSGVSYGFGAQYNISDNFAIRGELDRLKSKANLFTLGANYTF